MLSFYELNVKEIVLIKWRILFHPVMWFTPRRQLVMQSQNWSLARNTLVKWKIRFLIGNSITQHCCDAKLLCRRICKLCLASACLCNSLKILNYPRLIYLWFLAESGFYLLTASSYIDFRIITINVDPTKTVINILSICSMIILIRHLISAWLAWVLLLPLTRLLLFQVLGGLGTVTSWECCFQPMIEC